MEHTLGGKEFRPGHFVLRVLILVLVEHTLGEGVLTLWRLRYGVLILVLVEHTLGGRTQRQKDNDITSLNPCFSGTYSRRYWLRVAWPLERKS